MADSRSTVCKHDIDHSYFRYSQKALPDTKVLAFHLILSFSLFFILYPERSAHAKDNTEQVFQKGVLSLRDGDVSSAQGYFSAVIKEAPAHVMASYHLGVILLSKGALTQAQDHLERVVQLDPDMIFAYLRLAELYEQKGDLEKAIVALETVSPKLTDKTDSVAIAVSTGLERLKIQVKVKEKIREGVVSLRAGNAAKAGDVFREALRLEPHNPEIHHLLGVVLGIEGRFDEAIDHFNESLLLKPNLTDSSVRLIELYVAKGKYLLARESVEKALIFLDDLEGAEGQFLEAKRDEIEDRIEMNQLNERWTKQVEKKEIDAAILTLQEIVKIAPNHALAYYNLGNLQAQKERFELAEGLLKKAIEINPEYTEAHQRLGQVYEVNRQFKRAKAQYEAGLNTPGGELPPMKEILEQLVLRSEAGSRESVRIADEAVRKGRSAFSDNNMDEAVSMFEQAAFLNREDPEILFLLGMLYLQRDQIALARNAMLGVLVIAPDHRDAQRQLAVMDEKAGFLYQSFGRWRTIQDQGPPAKVKRRIAEIEAQTIPLLAEARAAEAAGNNMEAVEILKKASALAPDDPRIRIALGKLYTKTGMKTEAFTELNTAGFFEPTTGVAYFYLGELYTTGNQWRDAEIHYEKAVKSPDTSPELRVLSEKGRAFSVGKQKEIRMAERFFNRARRHLADQDYLTAIEGFQKVIGILPKHIESHYWIGTAFESLNELKDARRYYQKVSDINPKHIPTQERLGFIDEMEGRTEAAIKHYRKNLDLWEGRETPGAMWVKNRLKPLEKRFFVDIDQVVLSYDSNTIQTKDPEPDYTSFIGVKFTYFVKKGRRFQLPISLATNNTLFFRTNSSPFLSNNILFSQEVFSIKAISTYLPFSYSIDYNFKIGIGRGGYTGVDHVGILNLTWLTKQASYFDLNYAFDAFFSSTNIDLDSTRQTIRLTYNKQWGRSRSAIWYKFFDNDANFSDQAYLSNGLGFSFTWDFIAGFSTAIAYTIDLKDYDNIDSFGNKRRENTLQSASINVSYPVYQNIVAGVGFSYLQNSSNIEGFGATQEAQLSGQAESLGDFDQHQVYFTMNWSF
ncbi:MAG: tetratricopeptide repeat protein [Nitrospiria bacterium]